jgi:hypothetical protein
MALPKIDTPVYSLVLPLTNKELKFRPFLVKEQKNLLMSMESNDSDDIQRNIKQILQNCTLTEKIDIEKLPVIDVEYYFLNLRARSVGEVVINKYRCDVEVEGKTCGGQMECSLNLLDIKVENLKENKDVIKLTDNISIKMKYPEYSVMSKLSKLTNAADIAFEMIVDSIEYIYDGEQMHYAHESTPEELMQFIESLNQQQFAKIEDFFSDLPTIQKKIEMSCPRCGFLHNFKAEGLESFFG